MSDRHAPHVFVSYAHDSPEHMEQVRLFTTCLRTQFGLDAHLDQWYDSWRLDWSAWAIEHLTKADFILAIASPDYKRRADGMAPADEGRGSQFEAAIMRDNLTKNLRRETGRILPVVLPGGSIKDIPTFLNAYSTTRFEINEFTEAGVAGLLAAMTGQGQYPMPKRGEWRNGATGEPKCVPLTFGLPWLARSPNVRAGSAMIAGIRYDDSIVWRSASSTIETRGFVEIDLEGVYRRLTSMVGVLDDASEAFQIGHFRVYLDGKPQAERRAALGKPGTIDLNVTGVMKMRLEMYRPSNATAPVFPEIPATGERSWALPELAWGNPALF
jgi:SEFIR domain/NPCBM/NEW2 domain